MSHASGAVRFNDGAILYFEYNGTSDVCIPPLWETQEEVIKHWRADDPRWGCVCDVGAWEEVEIMSTYGGGFYWRGRACRGCNTLVDGLIPSFGVYGDDNYPFQMGSPVSDEQRDHFKRGYPRWSPWKEGP